ncbi:hypothetical protein A2U01_0094204, partial [Trifolium medium]|nr:hypothetical protein [Trifolium medium]
MAMFSCSCVFHEEEGEVGEDDDVASSYWPLNLLPCT